MGRSGVAKRWLFNQELFKQGLFKQGRSKQGLFKQRLFKQGLPRSFVWVGLLALCLMGVAVGQSIFRGNPAQAQSTAAPEVWPSVSQGDTSQSDPPRQDFALTLPPPQVHPLPSGLAEWQDTSNQGDYFEAVQPIPVGYLVWSRFPVQVYIEPVESSLTDQSPTSQSPTSQQERSQVWYGMVQQAVQEWQVYLPLTLTSTAETADITIWRSAPPLQLHSASSDTDQGSGTPGAAIDRLPRVRAAETNYEIVIRSNPTLSKLEHRCTIYLSPNQTPAYTQATARHELGHALGIWGHSSQPTDALYFSQVRDSPTISVRDVNTLKRIYQQPTRLGWALPSP